MSGQRRWWSGHELYGMMPKESRLRESFYQEYPYIDLSPQNEEEMELAYWKSIYPEKVKRIQQKVEEICEEMEYVNSPMYDEYPDRVYLRNLGNRIYESVMEAETDLETEEQRPLRQPDFISGPQRHHPPENSWRRNLIDVLLFQEMHRRRCIRGRCGRRWY